MFWNHYFSFNDKTKKTNQLYLASINKNLNRLPYVSKFKASNHLSREHYKIDGLSRGIHQECFRLSLGGYIIVSIWIDKIIGRRKERVDWGLKALVGLGGRGKN